MGNPRKYAALSCALATALSGLACSSSDSANAGGHPDGGSGASGGVGGNSGAGAGGGASGNAGTANSGGTGNSGGTANAGGSSGAGGASGSDGGACVPTCGGRVCGDDGCQGSCGSCGTGLGCDSGGHCVPSSCPPGCTTNCTQGCFDLGACAASGGATLDLEPNVYTLGVVGTFASGAPTSAELYYRPQGTATWSRGNDLVKIPDARLASSAFSLAPGTAYEIMVRAGTNVGCGTATTQLETPLTTAAETLYVDATATGGDGSSAKPFSTIAAALSAANPSGGTDVHVRAGVYREELAISKSGAAGHYFRILGDAGAILDGSAASPALAWQDETGGVFSAAWAGDPRYVSRDGQRLYHYDTLADLQSGLGHTGIAIAEGFFVEGGRLYVRSLDAPSSHTFQIPTLNTAILISGRSFVWIEGLEVRYYGEGDYAKGIDVTDASNDVVIRKNHLHDIPSALWVRKGSSHLRIEENQIHQSSVFSWPWATAKATDHENDAITLAGGRGAIVARNVITDIFNGVYVGSFDVSMDPTLAYDVDVYENRFTRIADDGLEPEGADVNARFWGNAVDSVHNGLSLAPITYGPVWGIRNRFSDYQESGFKVSNDTSGRVWLLHNTCFTSQADHNGMNVSGPFENIVFRNNVIRGTSYSIESTQIVSTDDLDYDSLYTTRGAPVIKWNDTRYDSLAALCTATGLECHGQGADPALLNPVTNLFAPTAGSPLIDAAVRLYGINDAYAGAAPDIGYVEYGASELPPAP